MKNLIEIGERHAREWTGRLGGPFDLEPNFDMDPEDTASTIAAGMIDAVDAIRDLRWSVFAMHWPVIAWSALIGRE